MRFNRFVLAMLVSVLVFSLVGCASDPKDATPSQVTYYDGQSTTQLNRDSVVQQVSAGKMDITFEAVVVQEVTQTHTHGDMKTASITLGMDADALADAIAESGYDAQQHRKVGENYIRHECGNSMTAYFYYTNDDRKNGLASVVYYGTAYGFEPSVTTVDQVKAVMGSPTTEAPANEKALSMFLFYEPGYTYLDYACGTNHVSFFFHENGTLGATVVYQDGLWIY